MSVMSVALRPKKLVPQLLRVLFASLVPIITSQPGAGKSDIIADIADTNELLLIDFRLSQADITDLNGLPRFNANGFAEFVPFDYFPIEGTVLPNNPKTGNPYKGWLLFFDEMTAAGKQLQAAAYKVILERKIGNKKLHKKVAIMAAGNRKEDNAVAFDMSTALQSRLIHFELEVNLADWVDWAVDNKVDSRVIGYLQWAGIQKLNDFKPDHTEKTYACPRTWSFVDKLIRGVPTLSVGEDHAVLAGTIGPGAALEFLSYCEVSANVPKYSTIIGDPANAAIPTEISQQYAVATMIGGHLESTSAKQAVIYIKRLRVELQVIVLRMAVRRNPQLKAVEEIRDLLIDLAAQQND